MLKIFGATGQAKRYAKGLHEEAGMQVDPVSANPMKKQMVRIKKA